MFKYLIAGLSVSSEFKLSVAEEAFFEGDPDILIRFTNAIQKPKEPIYADETLITQYDDFWFNPISGLQIRVSNGSLIEIEKTSNVSDLDINLFLVGSSFGIIFHQRKLIPFHSSAVEINGRAIAFTGESYVGKSTFAAALSQQGFGHISDDVCVADPAKKPLLIRAMPKGLKLWDEAAEELKISRGKPVGTSSELRKTYVKAATTISNDTFEFEHLYVLSKKDAADFEMQKVTGAQKHLEITRAIYREEWLPIIRSEEETFNLIGEIGKNISVFKFHRPRDLSRVVESAEFFLEHFKSTI